MYYYELEQKEKLNNRVTTPMAVITLLLGLAVFYFKGIKDIELNTYGWIFFTVYGVCILFIFIAIVLVFKSYYNYRYSYLPKPEIIESDINDIVAYYDSNYEIYFSDKGLKKDLIEEEIDNILYSYYKKATTRNIEMNERKFKYLRYTGNILLLTLLFAGLSIIPYQLSKEDKPTEVEIKNFDEIPKKTDEGATKMNQIQTNTQSNISTPPPKPQPSEPRVVPEEFNGDNLKESNK